VHDGGEIDVAPSNVNAEVTGAANLADRAGCSEDRLRGDTARVQAVAAKALPFDEGDPRTEARRSHSADQAGGAAANDDEVVRATGLRVLPALRADQPIEVLVDVLEGGHVKEDF
jgi:hypothetical protein